VNETTLITVLVENSARNRGFEADHGLAFHLRVGSERMPFDTGRSDHIMHDARSHGTSSFGLACHARSGADSWSGVETGLNG